MACKKKAFKDKDDAVWALHKIQTADNDGKKPIRAYECGICSKWHLTSKQINDDTPAKWVPKLDWSKLI